MTESVDRQTAVLRLRGADDILILCHKNPDGDTIGCAGALYLALKALGKNAAILCSDPIPKMYDYMELRWFDGSFNPAFVVAVDVASIQLFGENNNVPQYAAHTNLCIDHHASNSGYAYETLLDPGAAAACEFLLDVIVDMGVTITPQIANCLYTGIATDTGCFKFASTTPRTHMAAARVMEAGADVEKLNARLFESRSHARITAERMAMESLEYYFNDLCAVICLTWDQIESSGVAGAELEDLTSLRVSQCVDYKPSDDGAAFCGFDDPSTLTVNYKSTSGADETFVMYIGNQNMDGTGRYVRFDEDNAIYLMELSYLDPLMRLAYQGLEGSAA